MLLSGQSDEVIPPTHMKGLWKAANPKVEVEVVGGNTQTVLDALAAHRVMLALVEGPAMRQDVRLEPFIEDRMVCVVPADMSGPMKR